jgi:hypothetical protein
MKKFLLFTLIITCTSTLVPGQCVTVSYDTTSARENYSARILTHALIAKGYAIKADGCDFFISLGHDRRLKAEAFEIRNRQNTITVIGGDDRGIIYGVQALCEDVRNGMSLTHIKDRSDSAHLPFRGIKFDLPWDTYRHSYALDLHKETCADLKYWEAFLDMMSENRFNALTMWNLHPYTFLITPKNFPEASPWNAEQMKKWKELFGGIFTMAKERGIDTYIIPFNIFVTPEFAKAHNVALDNLEHHHYVNGDTSDIIKRYTRECVTQMLNEYPDLTGMGLTLGEAMGGMIPQQREDWMKETIIEGMRLANRTSKLIHRIPFSGNTASLGATSIEMEQVTRNGIEREAKMDRIEPPVWADLKFNWSHAHSTTTLIKVHGGKLYGTYWDPLPEKYKITWTARNEDFFCLRWGGSDFVREHIKTNTPAYVGGYFIGSETYIPAKDYFTNPEIKVNWNYAFERQWLFYKIWGRLLYSPSTPDDVFKNEFVRRYGKKAEVLFEASSLAGKTPLRLASSFDCSWDFTLYSEGFMALNPDDKRVEYISIDRQINQPPLDTSYVSILEYVNSITAKKAIDKNKITPPMLASMLEKDCRKALHLVKHVHPAGNTSLMFEIADIRTWANLGLFFSEKIKAGVELQTYRSIGNAVHKKNAVTHLEHALHYWDAIIGITRPLYNDMPLVHLSEQDGKSWKENDHLRFHWQYLRPDVVKDIEIAKGTAAMTVPAPSSSSPPAR